MTERPGKTTGDAYAAHRDAIAGMLDERKYPLAWVDREVAEGRIAVVGDEVACVGVTRREYPGGAVELHVMFAAGELEACLCIWDKIEAAAVGFDLAAVESRDGWVRALASRGFAKEQVRLVKGLR